MRQKNLNAPLSDSFLQFNASQGTSIIDSAFNLSDQKEELRISHSVLSPDRPVNAGKQICENSFDGYDPSNLHQPNVY